MESQLTKAGLERGEEDSGCQDEGCSFEIVLCCISTEEVVTKTVTFVTYPKSARDLKQKIEDDFNIPICAQTLQYESTILVDSDDLRSICLRSGDTIHLTYRSKANCSEVLNVVTRLKSLLGLFQVHLPSLSDEVPSDGENALQTAIQEGFMQELRNDVFSPWDSDVKQMNKDYFISIGGLDTLVRLYSLLLTQDWHMCPENVKHLVLTCPVALYHIAATYKLRRVLIKHGCIELLMNSLLLVKLKCGERVTVAGGTQRDSLILRDLMGSAMGTLCNMCEIPEAHIKIASQPNILEQFISIAHSPSYSSWWAQLVVSAFICFAHNAEVHQQLTSEEVLEGVVDTCAVWRNRGTETLDVLLLEYFVQLFLAQLILVSPDLIPPSSYVKVNDHMTKFLKNATVRSVSEQECKRGFFWSVFLPYVKLLFVPDRTQNGTNSASPGPNVSSLQLLSTESVLFCLQCTMDNVESRESFLTEKLNDYVVCMPWHVPMVLREKATSVLHLLSKHTQLQPPRLSILAKAKLAKMQFGLVKMIKMSSMHELLA